MVPFTGEKDIVSYKPAIIKAILNHVSSCKIYLFGSRASDTHTPRSDIDICIQAEKTLKRSVLEKINDDIDKLNIAYKIDIIDFHELDDTIKNHILNNAIEWYKND